MNEILILVAGIGMALASGPGSAGPSPADLMPGDPAPPFALPGSDGRTYRLEDYKGKQAVVLAWFPKAFTGG